MANLGMCGFGLASLTAGVEISLMANSPTLNTGFGHSDIACLQLSSLTSGQARWASRAFSVAGSTVTFAQFWLYIQTLPGQEVIIAMLNDSSTAITTPQVYVSLDSSGNMRLYDEDGQIGASFATLSTSSWHCVEMKLDRTASAGSHVVEGRVDFAVFATASNRSVSGNALAIILGANLAVEANSTGTWYFDDIVVNDATGSFMNTYPGGMSVGYKFPSGAGDNNAWLLPAGTAGSSTNYQQVDDPGTPDDAATYVKSSLLNQTDDYSFGPSGRSSDAVVYCVGVNTRHSNDSSSSQIVYVSRLKKASGATVAESGNITPNNTGWRTNAVAASVTAIWPNLLTYIDEPSTGVAWTQATLDTLQAGFRTSFDGTVAFVLITQIYVTYCYIEPQVTADSNMWFSLV